MVLAPTAGGVLALQKKEQKKQKNPLTQDGLPAKILALCFVQSRNPYQIGKEIYQANNSSRISSYCKKHSGKYFERMNDRQYRAMAEPIVTEMSSNLEQKGIALMDYEKKILVRLLDSNKFRSWLASTIGIEYMAKEGRNIYSAIARRLAYDSAFIVMHRRLQRLPVVDESQFHSGHDIAKSIDENLSILENNQYERPEFGGQSQVFKLTMEKVRELASDLFPDIRTADLSYEKMKKGANDNLNYTICLRLLPSGLLSKLVRLSEEGARSGFFDATAGL